MHTISVTFITRRVEGSKKARDDAAAELNDLIGSNQLAFTTQR
jgi:hypothetical protein